MEVWFAWAKKPNKCRYCFEVINTGEAMVIGRARKKKGAPWPAPQRWHLECFTDSGRQYLDANPYFHGSGSGRPALDITADVKEKRNKILRRYGAYQHRLKKLEGQYPPTPEGLMEQAVLLKRMQSCAEEIEQYGGVPKSWAYLVQPVRGTSATQHGALEAMGDEPQRVHREEAAPV
jgi:hypothetical protein